MVQKDSRSASAPKKLKVLVLEGTPRNRGLIHGKVMKDQIHEVVRLWKAMLAETFKVDAGTFIHRFVRQTKLVAAMKKDSRKGGQPELRSPSFRTSETRMVKKLSRMFQPSASGTVSDWSKKPGCSKKPGF